MRSRATQVGLFILSAIPWPLMGQLTDRTNLANASQGLQSAPPPGTSHQFEFRVSAVADNDIHKDRDYAGREEAVHGRLEYIQTQSLAPWAALRAGVQTHRIDFGSSEAPIPNLLQSASLILGVDFYLSKSVSLRLEARPGVYSDWESVTWEDVDVPIVLGAKWSLNDHIALYGGARFSRLGRYNIIPMGGVTIQFSDDFSMNVLYPEVKFEHHPSKDWSWSMGISFINGGYNAHLEGLNEEDEELENAKLTYRESRPFVGFNYYGFEGFDLFTRFGVVMGRVYDYYEPDRQIVVGAGGYLELGMRSNF